MTNKEVLQIAMRQSAADLQCKESDFLNEKNVIIEAGLGPNAKRYYREPIACNLISYGNNIVAATKSEYRDIVEEYLGKFDFFHCFETPNLHWLNERLEQKGQRICFMAEYYLPDLNRLQELPCDYELRLLGPEDFSSLYTKEWSNALCEDRKELDMLGVGAYDQGKLVGMAGCSADCDTMWQIGVDVLPEYRRKGIASALTSKLAVETLKRGKVPFYCTAWSNIRSARNAIKCGFLPAWVEMSAKPVGYVEKLNVVVENSVQKGKIDPSKVSIGIDGCKGGWIVATIKNGALEIAKYKTLEEITKENTFDGCLIDMIIGLQGRETDVRPESDARKEMKGRTSTIFPAPCREAVYGNTKESRLNANVRVLGKKFTSQTDAIIPKIREVDEFLQTHDEYKNLIMESHPEVCFARLNGEVINESKHTEEGIKVRTKILSNYLSEVSFKAVKERALSLKCNMDDITDSVCLAVVSNLECQGKTETIPVNPMKDETGLRMQMVVPKSKGE